MLAQVCATPPKASRKKARRSRKSLRRVAYRFLKQRVTFRGQVCAVRVSHPAGGSWRIELTRGKKKRFRVLWTATVYLPGYGPLPGYGCILGDDRGVLRSLIAAGVVSMCGAVPQRGRWYYVCRLMID